MHTVATILLTLVVSYLLGAIPFGYLVARWRGVDIFRHGSGNIGATNVGRVLGSRFGILVFLLDFAKGAVPTAIAAWIAGQPGELHDALPPGTLPVAAGLAAFLGHLFSIFLRLRGGKGVATAVGVMLVLVPGPALVAVLVWLALICAVRYMSLAVLLGTLALCLVRLGSVAAPFGRDQFVPTLFCLVAAGLVFVRHRSNLGRLLRGTENRLQETPAMLSLTKIVHVLALGLWFGSAVFFTFVVALTLFQTFESLGAAPPDQRPAWLPLPADFDKEKGTRLAGAAIAPLFPLFFALQGACGLLATATALTWTKAQPRRGLHRVRAALLVVALLTVLAGWPLVEKVGALRVERYAADAAVAASARAAFASWHLVSLLLEFVTVLLVTAATALAAWLPSGVGQSAERLPTAVPEDAKSPHPQLAT